MNDIVAPVPEEVGMELKDRIQALAESAGVESRDPLRCWVDAAVRCPYGHPGGQFIDRPVPFCGEHCQTYQAHVYRIIEHVMAVASPKTIRTFFEENHTSVISELDARADEFKTGSPERLALELAASILEQHGKDREILLVDDLPEENRPDEE